VLLAQVLLREYWQHSPIIVPADANTVPVVSGTHAAVLIGDKTFGLENAYQYTYDLAEIWHKHTNLPFVFAVWVATEELQADFLQRFNHALSVGIGHIPQLCQLIPSPNPQFSLEEYYTKYISYRLDEPKKKALHLFLQKISGVSNNR
jgi:chorismate dehydratase